MPIRELTDNENSRLLTQAEVDAIPDDTSVFIKWSGGNGPHKYKTIQAYGMTCVQYPEHVAHLAGTPHDPIHFVGKSRGMTRVYLDTEVHVA